MDGPRPANPATAIAPFSDDQFPPLPMAAIEEMRNVPYGIFWRHRQFVRERAKANPRASASSAGEVGGGPDEKMNRGRFARALVNPPAGELVAGVATAICRDETGFETLFWIFPSLTKLSLRDGSGHMCHSAGKLGTCRICELARLLWCTRQRPTDAMELKLGEAAKTKVAIAKWRDRAWPFWGQAGKSYKFIESPWAPRPGRWPIFSASCQAPLISHANSAKSPAETRRQLPEPAMLASFLMPPIMALSTKQGMKVNQHVADIEREMQASFAPCDGTPEDGFLSMGGNSTRPA